MLQINRAFVQGYEKDNSYIDGVLSDDEFFYGQSARDDRSP
jgi:hypothetical protein